MEKLERGIHAFQTRYFAEKRHLFQRLVQEGQDPETLFITCSDSRVVPNLITNAGPGDLFILRNVGNVIPSEGMVGGSAAAIEYAVVGLGISNIVICGHTHCGAMEAVLHPEAVEGLPYVKQWLSQTSRVREIVCERYAHLDGEALLTATAEENVLVQIENLRAFPFVTNRLESGELHVSGWIFNLETGDVYVYEPELEDFVEIGLNRAAPRPQSPPAR